MFCPNCGKENGDESKFCAFCGTPLQQEQQGQQSQPEQQEQPGEQSQQSQPEQPGQSGQQGQPNWQPKPAQGNVLITVGAIVFAVLYGIVAIRSLWSLGSTMISCMRWNYFRGFGFSLVIGLLNVAACLVLVFALILLGLGRKKETTEVLLFGVIAAGAIRIVQCILNILILLIESAVYSWSYVGMFGYESKMLCALVTVGVMLILVIVTGECQMNFSDVERLKATFLQIPGALAEALQNIGKKEAGQGNACGQQSNYQQANYQQNNYQQNGYQQANYQQGDGQNLQPAFRVNTERSLLIYIVLSIVTCGIYAYYFLYTMARDANAICEGDGEKTGGLLAFILLNIVTCGIYGIYWEYKLGNRLADNAPRYGLQFTENGTSVLVWYLFGILICGIGPYIAMNILIKNMNRLAVEYNRKYGL